MANNSWGTPPHLIESARTAMGSIDTDTGKPEKGNDRDQIIVYLGDNPTAFCEEFSKYGVCHLPYRPVTFL